MEHVQQITPLHAQSCELHQVACCVQANRADFALCDCRQPEHLLKLAQLLSIAVLIRLLFLVHILALLLELFPIQLWRLLAILLPFR